MPGIYVTTNDGVLLTTNDGILIIISVSFIEGVTQEWNLAARPTTWTLSTRSTTWNVPAR
jgi:hypothetical protein